MVLRSIWWSELSHTVAHLTNLPNLVLSLEWAIFSIGYTKIGENEWKKVAWFEIILNIFKNKNKLIFKYFIIFDFLDILKELINFCNWLRAVEKKKS